MPGMMPDDVYALTGAADPRVSPDGSTVAYVVWSIDKEANEYRSAIWLAPMDGSAPPRQFTSGTTRDAGPRWSPDGERLAFTSKRAGDHMQLFVMPIGGGEPTKLTDLKEDVTDVIWAPDGTRAAFASRVPDPAYSVEDDKRRPPRRFTRLHFKLDTVGWTGDRPQRSARRGPRLRRSAEEPVVRSLLVGDDRVCIDVSGPSSGRCSGPLRRLRRGTSVVRAGVS